MHPLIASLYAASLQFAVGTLLATIVSDSRGQVTAGFLRLSAVTAVAGALLAWSLVGSGEAPERVSAGGLVLLTLVYTVMQFMRRGSLRLTLGWATLALGTVGLVLAAVARPSPSLGPALTAATSAASAVALGTSLAAMVLGHWYLVTPRLSAKPLRLLCDLAIVSLVALTGVALWYVLERPAATAFGVDTPYFRWTGFISVTVVPIGATIAARFCCEEWPRGRAIQAATGLLYITAAIVLAGALAGNMVVLTG
jgi:hypothetical protein